ncbi:MAG: dTDP-4-dehydrorhamnose 3,5-epimerase [Pseudomonadota bacterium]
MTIKSEAMDIPDVKLITPPRFGDDRGFFSETYNKERFVSAGISADFIQDNHSLSATKGTVRGLHYQSPPFAQAKLVRVLRGAIIDVAVDVRKGSETYGQWVSAELSAENGTQIFVPRGFLHGFTTLVPNTEVAYKVDNYYSAECDGSVAWNDTDLAIDWKIDMASATVSDKDARAPCFADFETPFQPA